MSIGESLDKLNELILNFGQFSTAEISEADTRCKLLDTILVDILGWDEHDIQREGYVKPGFFDYEVSTASFRFIIEAKKTLETFVFPTNHNHSKLKVLLKGNTEHIEQIRNYIIKRNLSYGVISNGHQFIIARFLNINSMDWMENQAVIFHSLEDVRNRFVEFHNLLSKQAISSCNRINLATDVVKPKVLVNSIQLSRKGEELIRNELSAQLIPIVTKIFRDIYDSEQENDYNFLKKCYIKNHDVDKHNSELGSFFSDDPPKFDSRILPIRNTENTQSQLITELDSCNTTLPDPIVIIGAKGAGKTTFIKYFTEIVLDEKAKKSKPIIYIDFRKYTHQDIENTQLIFNRILEQIYDVYPKLNLTKLNILKTIYLKEITRNTEGIWSHLIKNKEEMEAKICEYIEKKQEDKVSHLCSISTYLIGKCNRRLCIILDNADQLDIDSQKSVFLLAQSIHLQAKCLVFVSLREGYYYQWRQKPPFDAYHSNVFHITAPPYRSVIQKRIEFVVNSSEFKDVKGDYAGKSIKFSKNALSNFFKSLYKTLFDSKNSEVLSFLEETSYPNIRAGLEKFNLFLISGHTNVTQYIVSDTYDIPIWEFIKSVALESKYYYSHEVSEINNLFYPTPGNQNHFTKIRILQFLLDHLETKSTIDPYVQVSTICSVFGLIGYNRETIQAEILDLLNNKFIETSEYSFDVEDETEITEETNVRATLSASYYIHHLLNRMCYLDLVLQDTPIYDNATYELLLKTLPHPDLNGKMDIAGRVKCVSIFIEYLLKQEIADHSRADVENCPNSIQQPIIRNIINSNLKSELERISKKTGVIIPSF